MSSNTILKELQNMDQLDIAVVGALGAVGREMIKTLEKSSLPVRKLIPMDISSNEGKICKFRNQEFAVVTAEENAFEGVDIALFSAGAEASKVLAPLAAKKGTIVVDNSSQWRMDPEVPLVVPEVNPEALRTHKGIIANPNCSTIQMLVACKPLHDNFRIKRIVVSTYQAVSGSGQAAINELRDQSESFFKGLSPEPKVYPHSIAFNAIPHIDVFLDNGYTKEEMKMVHETHKILDPSIMVSPTAVRIPVFRGHSESVNLEFERSFEMEEVMSCLSEARGIILSDSPRENIYPLAREAEGKGDVFVGRVRRDITVSSGLNLWVVADNLLKGAALNAVQIAETLYSMNLIKNPVLMG